MEGEFQIIHGSLFFVSGQLLFITPSDFGFRASDFGFRSYRGASIGSLLTTTFVEAHCSRYNHARAKLQCRRAVRSGKKGDLRAMRSAIQ